MTDYLKSPLFQLKVGELILSILCVGFFFSSLEVAFFLSSLDSAWTIFLVDLVHLTVFGFILLNALVIVSVLTQEPLSRTLFLIISGAGCLLFVISGVIMLTGYIKADVSVKLLISSFVALLNGLVYGADTYYIVMYFQD